MKKPVGTRIAEPKNPTGVNKVRTPRATMAGKTITKKKGK
jgi:hypothetical protein